MAEYEACIMGLKAAIDLRIKFLNVFGDSALVISQIKGEWDTKHLNLIPYKEHVLTLLPHFEEVTFEHFPQEENQLAGRASYHVFYVQSQVGQRSSPNHHQKVG